MRILHLVNRVSDRGDGIANVCVDAACEQAHRGHTVALACEPGGFVPLCQEEGVQWFDVNLHWQSLRDVTEPIRRLRAVIDEFAPDIIHTHTMRAVVAARLARRRRRNGPKIVATVHNEYQRGVILMGLADRVVGVSEAVSEAMAQRRIPRKRITTVTNGITGSARNSVAHTKNREELAGESILAIGAVSRRKGADLLIDAFERIAPERPAAHLYFLGNVDWDEVPRRIGVSPVGDRITLLGFSPNTHQYLKAATLFVLASRRDPFPLVLLEALDAGTPIVASSVDGIPEALNNGAAGVLVPSEDVDALTAAISGVLASSARRASLSKAGRKRSAFYSVAKMTDGYTRVYEDLGVKS
jgi:glycosyltransferase involved in cell wall biosynthesis